MKLRKLVLGAMLGTALLATPPAFAQDLQPTAVSFAEPTQQPDFDGSFGMTYGGSHHCPITISNGRITGSCSTLYNGKTCMQSLDGTVTPAEQGWVMNYFGGWDQYGEIQIALTATNGNCAGLRNSFPGAEYMQANQANTETPSSYRLGANPQGSVTRN